HPSESTFEFFLTVLTPIAPPSPPAPTHATPADIAAAITGHRVETVAQPTTPSAQVTWPTTMSTIFRSAFQNYGERLLTHLGYGVIAVVVSGVLVFGLTGGTMLLFNQFNSYAYTSPSPLTFGAIVFVLYSITLLIMTTIGTWLWSCITISASTTDANRHFLTIAKEATRRIPQVWVANFVCVFILGGAVTLASTMSGLGSIALASILDIDSMTFIIPIGIFLLAIGIASWIGTYLSFTPFIALAGRARGLRAILVSDAMVRGSWWRIFGWMVAYVAPAFVLSFLVSFLLDQLDSSGILPSVISSILIYGFLLPFGITYALGVFNAVSAQKPNVEPAGRGTAIALLTIGGIGCLLVFGIGSMAIGNFFSLFNGF
ncbi:MAG: hypothetical protein Q8O51_00425, partial [bacterium]|nr:hypothetical protein [bacterium]